MTLSLRTWRYGSKASALRSTDPVGMLTIRALLEADVDEQPPVVSGSIEVGNDWTAKDDTEAVDQSDRKEMLNQKGPAGDRTAGVASRDPRSSGSLRLPKS
jgi:hypothetical protein